MTPTDDNQFCPHCKGSGEGRAMTNHLGPDDHEYDCQCPTCGGDGSLLAAFHVANETRKRLERECEMRYQERRGLVHQRDHYLSVLTDIFALTVPNPDGIEVNGVRYIFKDPNAAETLRGLSKALQAIAEKAPEVRALLAEQARTQPTNLAQECAKARRHGFLDALSGGTARELCALLRSGVKQLEAWHAKYGEHQPQWLPPAGDVRWMEDVAAALDGRTTQPHPLKAEQATKEAGEDAPKLWLWKNFVDGRPEYWAFDNPYPINLTDGDPQTLGEPCGYAIFKPSRQGRFDKSEEQVLAAIRAARAAERKA